MFKLFGNCRATLLYFRRGLSLEHLRNRALIKISGTDAASYLQGLITNDMQHLLLGKKCMYSMFLNTKGRVLYDTIVYRIEDNAFFIECDTEVVKSVERHLKMYKIRRQVDVTTLCDRYNVFALFETNMSSKVEDKNEDKSNVPLNLASDQYIFCDPRTSLLGHRIIASKDLGIDKITSSCNVEIDSNKPESYRWLRYFLGVGEGVSELPPGECFPLESNCDYLHGVSFHKGCYIGQELTARTHHMGVIRKRLMPLNFLKVPSNYSVNDTILSDGKNLGKLRGIEGTAGLALLRIDQCLGLEEIKIGNGMATTKKPAWWPLEAPKDILSAQRND